MMVFKVGDKARVAHISGPDLVKLVQDNRPSQDALTMDALGIKSPMDAFVSSASAGAARPTRSRKRE